jgi:hypothetical protein
MIAKSQLTTIAIHMSFRGSTILELFLDREGNLSRLGSGDPDDDERRLVVTRCQPATFTELLKLANDQWFSAWGRYVIEPIIGARCKLELVFETADAAGRMEFSYGAESEGPHGSICDFVVRAVELTEAPYQACLSQRTSG